jgi:predicted secreted hydrolase
VNRPDGRQARPADANWRRYPYTPDWGDPHEFTFPAADGYRPTLGMATYFVDGFLTGTASGRPYAFMVIFTDMLALAKRVRVSFYTFALYDLARRHYGTYTDFDFPRPPRIRRSHKLAASEGHLALRYASGAGPASWTNRRDGAGTLLPFAHALELPGVDQHGAAMHLVLEVEATRPPGPLGGRELGGEMMFLGAPRTYSYFQSGLRMRGRLRWGERDEDVAGDVGWIDRQWAPDAFTRHQDRHSASYRNEWRVMQLDNGWDMSLFHQYARQRGNAVVPWSGMTAQGPAPAHELHMTTRVELIVPEFIRSPGLVRSRIMLSEGPRYFPYRYQVRVPEWEMDVVAEPFVDAPAHQLPIEYWTGPVRLAGVFGGRPVTGLGFDERSRPRTRGFEVAEALRITLDHLPGIDEATRRLLVYRAWEVEALALRGDLAAAAAYLRARLRPGLERLPEPAREQVSGLAGDVLEILERRIRAR